MAETLEREANCPTCGLTSSQLPPSWRFVIADANRNGILKCRHPFGIPAKDVPDWRTHEMDGTPYAAAVI